MDTTPPATIDLPRCEADECERPALAGDDLCDSHRQSENEAAWERSCESYYGSSSPQTVEEHYQLAVRERRSGG